MKTIIATTALALSLTAPAFADKNVQAFFALGNDSAAERVLSDTSIGNTDAAQVKVAMYNDSAAELTVKEGSNVTRGTSAALVSFFALSNDSAAEINR